MESCIVVVIFLLTVVIARRGLLDERRRLGDTLGRVVWVGLVDVLLAVARPRVDRCLAIALSGLDVDECQVEHAELLRVLKRGGQERDHLLRERSELGGDGREWCQASRSTLPPMLRTVTARSSNLVTKLLTMLIAKAVPQNLHIITHKHGTRQS
jgi:hypothetical protein